MRIIDSHPLDRELMGVIILNKSEAIQMVHDLVNMLTDAPGAGSAKYAIYRSKSMPMDMSQVALAIKETEG